jgi:hypothetical protein
MERTHLNVLILDGVCKGQIILKYFALRGILEFG